MGVTVTPLQPTPYNGSDFHSYNGVMITLDRSLHSDENDFFLYNKDNIGMRKQYYREVQ